MKGNKNLIGKAGWAVIIIGVLLLAPEMTNAHCDTLSGPVVKDAQLALDKGDVTPVLKWVKKESEPEVRELFAKTLVVREKGPEAKELADRYFFETLVRIHRAGEGAPYTGLKPAGTDLGPAVKEADLALQTGKLDKLNSLLTASVSGQLKDRYGKVMNAKKHKDESVAKGREYVEAYVGYVHFAEKIYDLSHEKGGHHEGGEGAEEDQHK